MSVVAILCMFLSLVAGEANRYGNVMSSLPSLLQQSANIDKFALPDDVDITHIYTELLRKDSTNSMTAGENVSLPCMNNLNQTLQALTQNQTWAMQFLDAAGKPSAGILQGSIYWMGQFQECLDTTATIFTGPNNTKPTHPFKGQYCKVGIPIGQKQSATAVLGGSAIPQGDLVWGICVPSTCSQQDVLILINSALALVSKALKNTTLRVDAAVCQKDDLELDARAIISITILSLLGLLVVIGTVYDVFVIHRMHANPEFDELDKEETAPLVPCATSGPSRNIKYRGYDSVSAQNEGHHDIIENKNLQENVGMSDIGLWGKILQSFSVYTNGSKLLSTKTQAGSLGAIHGIRFITMSWIMLGHTYAFIMPIAKNSVPLLVNHIKSFSFMTIVNAVVAVDTFFMISGLLVAYLSLKELRKVGGIRNFRWGMFYFHRFWRLTPAYALVMVMYIPLSKYLANGPFWNQDGNEKDYCADSWWMNILYINNFWSIMDTCMGWSWYLANDMQFYILSPLLLIPMFVSSVFGGLVCFAFLVSTFTVTAILSIQNNYPMNVLGTGGDPTKIVGYFNAIYIKPYCRIGPYIVGMIVGYILYKTDCKKRISKLQNLIGWLVAAVCCLYTLYGNFNSVRGEHIPSKGEVALHSALNSSVWSLGVGWIIYACATGYGGIINSFLSWKLFIPLSRLTYLSYLIHPVIIEVVYYAKQGPLTLTDLDVVCFFLAHLLISNAIAFVLSLVFESPFMGLEKALFPRERKR